MIDSTKDILTILKSLIEIYSESGHEEKICDGILKDLEKKGLKITKKANNIVCDFDYGMSQTVALVGHIDTVSPSKENQTKAELKGKELFGLGACDMKAGLACMLKLADDLKNKKIKPTKNIRLVFYEGEEVALPNGLTKLINERDLEGTDFAFVLEPTNGEYSLGCLGSMTVHVNVKGKAAHSSLAWLGDNSVYNSQKIISAIKDYGNKEELVSGQKIIETMNITQIATNNKHNVIPQECILTINYRFSPTKSSLEAEKVLGDLIKQEFKVIDNSPSCIVGKNAENFLKPEIKRHILQAWTDIAQLNLAGIPAVNYGPGDISVAHTPEERISIEELNNFYNSLIKHLIN